MLLRLRYLYRRLLLAFLPARAYVLRSGISATQIRANLLEIIYPDKWYFLLPGPSNKPYNGKFGLNSFVAIKNGNSRFQRPIKVKGQFFIYQDQIFVKVVMSNPFSIVNISLLALVYITLILFRVFPFPVWWANVLLYTVPLLVTYLLTNISFQATYKREKHRFFKIFKGTRLTDAEIRAFGIS